MQAAYSKSFNYYWLSSNCTGAAPKPIPETSLYLYKKTFKKFGCAKTATGSDKYLNRQVVRSETVRDFPYTIP